MVLRFPVGEACSIWVYSILVFFPDQACKSKLLFISIRKIENDRVRQEWFSQNVGHFLRCANILTPAAAKANNKTTCLGPQNDKSNVEGPSTPSPRLLAKRFRPRCTWFAAKQSSTSLWDNVNQPNIFVEKKTNDDKSTFFGFTVQINFIGHFLPTRFWYWSGLITTATR